MDTVGSGRTHKLTGVAVVEVSDTPLYLGVGMGNYTDRSVIDMRGNGDMSPASSTLINVCVLLEIDPGRDVLDRNDAAHAAALLVSDALADAIKDLEPPELDVYELGKADPSLPKIVYILCQHSPEHHAGSVRGWGDHLYGLTRLHPAVGYPPKRIAGWGVDVRRLLGIRQQPYALRVIREARQGPELPGVRRHPHQVEFAA